MYRFILIDTYFSHRAEPNFRIAVRRNVSEGVIEYRKREAIKLFGIMIWLHCQEREKEDIDNGIVPVCIAE